MVGAPSFVEVVVLRVVVGTRLHCGRDHVDEDVWIPAKDRHANKSHRIRSKNYDIDNELRGILRILWVVTPPAGCRYDIERRLEWKWKWK